MKFIKADDSNIYILYSLNKQLAVKENQKELFTASKKEYKKAFLSKDSIADAILIYKGSQIIGFAIFTQKFASYLASKVLFIEDVFLVKPYDKKKYINKVLQHIIKKAKKKNYCRVEMRVLKNYSIDKKLLKENGLYKIKKWDTYRVSL